MLWCAIEKVNAGECTVTTCPKTHSDIRQQISLNVVFSQKYVIVASALYLIVVFTHPCTMVNQATIY